MSSGDELAPGVAQALAFVGQQARREHALFRELPIKTEDIGRGRIRVAITLPPQFADGDVIHGGLYTILLDTLLAVAGWTQMDEFLPQATISLHTDFFSDAAPGETVICEASCAGIVNDVAFCKGAASRRDGTLLVQAAGTFLVGTTSKRKESRL